MGVIHRLIMEFYLHDLDSISKSQDCQFYTPMGRSENQGDCLVSGSIIEGPLGS
jgi:hypothetical protein